MTRVFAGKRNFYFSKTFVLFAILIFSQTSLLQAMRRIQTVKKSAEDSTIFVQNAKELSSACLALDGRWDYFKESLVQSSDFYPVRKNVDGVLISLPHCFEKGVNYSSYHCRIEGLLPNTNYAMSIYGRIFSCCRIWCNRRIVGVAGVLGTDKNSTKAAQSSEIISLLSDENGVLDIVMHVVDYELGKGGIVKIPVISEKAFIQKKCIQQFFFRIFVSAFLIMLAIYNTILIFMNRKPLVYFGLAALCVFFILSILSTGISIFNFFFPKAPFWFEMRLSVLLFAITVRAYIFYMGVSRKVSNKKIIVLYGISLANMDVLLFIPIKIFEAYKIVFIAISLLLLCAVFAISLNSLINKNSKLKTRDKTSKFLYNFDMAVNVGILLAYFYDFLIADRMIALVYSYSLLTFAALLFGVMQCTIPVFTRSLMNHRIQQSSEHFEQNNNLLKKIIPEQVLKFMNVESVTKVVQGGCHSFDAVILYVEIRYFNQLVKSLEKKEMFEIVSEYYKAIVPLVEKFGGYVAQYMNHGCLAFFPEKNDSAVRCAVSMQKAMGEVRRNLRREHSADITIGIAIHVGKIVCGFVGHKKRVASMNFSPEIKNAINIGKQTSKTNRNILITEEAMAYCRSYVDCMYEGHFIMVKGNRTLVYDAMPFKKEAEEKPNEN